MSSEMVLLPPAVSGGRPQRAFFGLPTRAQARAYQSEFSRDCIWFTERVQGFFRTLLNSRVISNLSAAPLLDHLGVHFGAQGQLLDGNPFVAGVSLGNIAWSVHDQIFQLGEHAAIGSV